MAGAGPLRGPERRCGAQGSGTTIYSDFAPGTWHLAFCAAVNPGYTGSGNAGTRGTRAPVDPMTAAGARRARASSATSCRTAS
jgi:hypothetical protein